MIGDPELTESKHAEVVFGEEQTGVQLSPTPLPGRQLHPNRETSHMPRYEL